jgi:hypothetical protein
MPTHQRTAAAAAEEEVVVVVTASATTKAPVTPQTTVPVAMELEVGIMARQVVMDSNHDMALHRGRMMPNHSQDTARGVMVG